jgi:putative membrane protein (TIGR04086 family)
VAVKLDRAALFAGIAVSLLICVPAALIGQALDDSSSSDSPSTAVSLLAIAVLAGLVIGATVAARRQTLDAPLVHGMVTAIVTFVLVQGAGVLRRFASSEDVSWSRILSSALLSMVAGTVGGLIGGRLRHEAEQRP